MPAIQHSPIDLYDSQPRAVPFLLAVAIYAGLLLLFANGIGVIQIVKTIDPPPVVVVPDEKKKPTTNPEFPPPLQAGWSYEQDLPPLDEPVIRIEDPHSTMLTERVVDAATSSGAPHVAAHLLRKIDPDYPLQSRRLDEEGVVLLRLTISPQGRVIDAQIARSSGYARLDQAALQAVHAWVFAPARQGEQPIVSIVTAPVRFDLSKR